MNYKKNVIPANWERLPAEDFYTWLVNFLKAQFSPLADLSLAEIIIHRSDEPQDYIPTLRQACLPLLRPDFDKTGGRAGYETRLILSADSSLKTFQTQLRKENGNWEERHLPGLDLLSFCRLRSLIPFKTLEDRFKQDAPYASDSQEGQTPSRSNGRWRTVR